MNVGEIIASLSLNTSNFMSSLNQANSQLRSTANQMGSTFGGSNNNLNNMGRTVDRVNSSFKDMTRIVNGILIAQIFYRGVNAITNAAGAVLQFSNNMQQATISMEYFLGSQDRAQTFLGVMKDFAAVTPFSTEEAMDMSRRLMAMGVQAENVKSVLGTLTDAASATGGTPEQMNRIVLALGQMKTNGYVAGQELRQLAEAGIPAYKILKEELGLTTDQLKEIGKLKISGDLGAAAILKGLEKRYEGAAARIAETVPGMWSTIKDDFLLISEQMFKAPYGALDNFLRYIRNGMETARQLINTKGLGGLFESMFTPETQTAIRNTIVGIKSLAASFIQVASVIGPIISNISAYTIQALGSILPPIAGLVKMIVNLTSVAVQTFAPMRYLATAILGLLVAEIAAKSLLFLWRVTQLGSVCTFVAGAIRTLSGALATLYAVTMANPIVAVIAMIAAVILYLAFTSKMASNALDQLGAKLMDIAGFGNINDILKPTDVQKKATDEFNKKLADVERNLKGIGKGLTKTGDAAKNAGKKVKDSFVASFDELYSVPEVLVDINTDLYGEGDNGLPNMFDISDITEAFDKALGAWQGPKNFDPSKLTGKIYGFIPRWKNADGPGPDSGGPTDDEDQTDKETNDIPKSVPETKRSRKAKRRNRGKNRHLIELEPIINIDTTELAALTTKVTLWATNIKKNITDALDTTWSALYAWTTSTSTNFATWYNATYSTFELWSKNNLTTISGWAQSTSLNLVAWSYNTLSTIAGWCSNTLNALSQWRVDSNKQLADWNASTVGITNVWGGLFAASISKPLDISWGNLYSWSGNVQTELINWSAITSATIEAWGVNLVAAISEPLNTSWSALYTWSGKGQIELNNWLALTGKTLLAWSSVLLTSITVPLDASWANIYAWSVKSQIELSNWSTLTLATVASWGISVSDNIYTSMYNSYASISSFCSSSWNSFKEFLSNTASSVGTWSNSVLQNITTFANSAWNKIAGLATSVGASIADKTDKTVDNIKSSYSGLGEWSSKNSEWLKPVTISAAATATTAAVVSGVNAATTAAAAATASAASALSTVAAAIGNIIMPIGAKYELDRINPNRGINVQGFATGGIIDRDRLIRVGEGGNREVIIPLENSTHMRPFSAAVANDLANMLNINNTQHSNDRTPVFVYNLIGDENGLKELERKLDIIRINESQRKGVSYA